MKIDGNFLWRRRMELGLTSRSAAKEAKVSSATIKHLEETGDAGVLIVSMLSAILDALCLSLTDVVEHSPVPDADEEHIRTVGAFLASQSKGVPLAGIA